MAWITPDSRTNIAGTKTITYSTPWGEFQEFLYLNGTKLSRDTEYSVTRSIETLPIGQVDTITLVTPIAQASDVLELNIYTDPASESIEAKLDAILMATAGSWIWDKSSGVMTMIDSYGIEGYKFEVTDNSELASRERRQDLEV